MKFLVSLCLLSIGLVATNPSYAHSTTAKRPSFARDYVKASVSDICTEQRFQNYMNLAVAMRDYVSPYEYAELYLPLKKKAAIALTNLRVNGPLSNRTHQSLYSIVKFVSANQTGFETLWEVEAFFDIAQDLLEMTTSLERDLQ